MGNFVGTRSDCLFGDIRASVVTRMGKIPWYVRYHQEPRRFEDDYDICSDILGSGANGDIRLANSKLSHGQKVAVKSFALSIMNDEDREFLKSEVENYLCMDHPHITRLLDVYESTTHVHMVMECMEGGDLFDRVSKSKFSEEKAGQAMRQMLLALNYMHSNGYVHRDVKLENFVFDAKQSDHLKLIDFGFSTKWDATSNERMNTSLGTLSYCAPEVIRGSYTSQCDMWSLGVIGFILLSSKMPFSGSDARMKHQIRTGSYSMKSSDWYGISAEAKEFIRCLLEVDASKRLTAQEALEHPWIRRYVELNESTDRILVSLRQYGRTSSCWRCCVESLAWSSSNEDQAKVRNHFLALSSSQQGSIAFEDLRSAMFHKFSDMEDLEFENICRALDHNNNRTVRYSDFLAAMIATQIPLVHAAIATTFRRLDLNKYGLITADDLSHMIGNAGKDIIQEIAPDSHCISLIEFSSYLGYPRIELHRKVAMHRLPSKVIKKGKTPPRRTGNSSAITRAKRAWSNIKNAGMYWLPFNVMEKCKTKSRRSSHSYTSVRAKLARRNIKKVGMHWLPLKVIKNGKTKSRGSSNSYTTTCSKRACISIKKGNARNH